MEIEEVSHIEKFSKLTQIMSKVHSVMKLKHDCFYSSCKAEEQCHFIYLFIFSLHQFEHRIQVCRVTTLAGKMQKMNNIIFRYQREYILNSL